MWILSDNLFVIIYKIPKSSLVQFQHSSMLLDVFAFKLGVKMTN